MFGELIACDLGERVVRERCLWLCGRVGARLRWRTGSAAGALVRVCDLRLCAGVLRVRNFAAWYICGFAWLRSLTRDARSGSFVFLSFVRFLRLRGDGAGSALVVRVEHRLRLQV